MKRQIAFFVMVLLSGASSAFADKNPELFVTTTSSGKPITTFSGAARDAAGCIRYRGANGIEWFVRASGHSNNQGSIKVGSDGSPVRDENGSYKVEDSFATRLCVEHGGALPAQRDFKILFQSFEVDERSPSSAYLTKHGLDELHALFPDILRSQFDGVTYGPYSWSSSVGQDGSEATRFRAMAFDGTTGYAENFLLRENDFVVRCVVRN